MDEQSTLALTFAADLAKQLITLATGILALSITFAKDLLGTAARRRRRTLASCWCLYLASMLFGIWSLMALTGLAAEGAAGVSQEPISLGFNARLPAVLQIGSFVIATALMIYFGFVTLSARDGSAPELPGTGSPAKDDTVVAASGQGAGESRGRES